MFIGIADARCNNRNNAIQNSPPEYFKMVMFIFSNMMAEDHVHSPTEYKLMEVKQNYKKIWDRRSIFMNVCFCFLFFYFV